MLVLKTQSEHRNRKICRALIANSLVTTSRAPALCCLKQKRAARVIQGYWRQNQSREVETEDFMCPICYDEIGSDSAKTQCGSVPHCLLAAMAQENVNCPMCRGRELVL